MANFRNTLVTSVMMYDKVPSGTQWLLETAALHGIELVPFGPGRKWEGYVTSKVLRFFDWASKLKHYDYIVFVDGTDSLFATDLGELHACFDTYGAEFIMAGERPCWPYKEYQNTTPNAPHPFRFACSGFFMATWPEFIKQMEKLVTFNRPDSQHTDQGRWQRAWMEGVVDMTIDHRCLLSQSLGRMLTGDLEKAKRPRNTVTDTFPCTFHANGGSKGWLPKIRELILR